MGQPRGGSDIETYLTRLSRLDRHDILPLIKSASAYPLMGPHAFSDSLLSRTRQLAAVTGHQYPRNGLIPFHLCVLKDGQGFPS